MTPDTEKTLRARVAASGGLFAIGKAGQAVSRKEVRDENDNSALRLGYRTAAGVESVARALRRTRLRLKNLRDFDGVQTDGRKLVGFSLKPQ